MNIIMIGFMGTGKSAVGQALAKMLSIRFLDTDAEIERVAGRTIPQMFSDDGEAAFRARETAILSSLVPLELSGVRHKLVLATGGGTPLRAENAALLKQIGTVVWLKASPEAILARVGPNYQSRPLLVNYQDNPHERIKTLLAERMPRYAALADFTLDTSGYAGPEDASEAILALLALRKE